MVAKISLKDAAKNAKAFVADLYREDHVSDLLLEEIRLSSDEREWLVTIGFMPPWMNRGVTAVLGPHPKNRAYKVVSVDAQTGEVRDLRIRTPGSESPE